MFPPYATRHIPCVHELIRVSMLTSRPLGSCGTRRRWRGRRQVSPAPQRAFLQRAFSPCATLNVPQSSAAGSCLSRFDEQGFAHFLALPPNGRGERAMPQRAVAADGYKLGAWHDVGWWQKILSDAPGVPRDPVPLPKNSPGR